MKPESDSVAHRERLYLAGALMERIQKADVPVAAQAEDVGDVFLNEIIDDDLATIHAGQYTSPCKIRYGVIR